MRIVLVILAFWALPAQADENDPCRCARSKATVERNFNRADVVFVGTAEDVQFITGPARRRLQGTVFRIHHMFKGERTLALSIYTDPGMLCSYSFEKSESYLVYAWREHRLKNEYTTTRCVRTAPFKEAAEDLRELSVLSLKGERDERN